jgi:PhnB protein
MSDEQKRPTDGLTPFLAIRGGKGQEALAFYERAFAAQVVDRNVAKDGVRLMQAALRINSGWLMLSDEFPEFGYSAAQPGAVTLHLQVDDADAWWRRALAAGATVAMDIADQFWGDRYGQLNDPFGHEWSVASPLKSGG